MADRPPPPDATEELVAYLDGELDAKAAEAVAARLGLDPKLRAEADGLQRAWDVLDLLPRPHPSASFANRTITQVIPVPTQAYVPATMPALHAARGRGFWLVASILIALAGLGGFFGRRAVVPTPAGVDAEQVLEDAKLLKNLRLYRNVDDLEFARALAEPELFGDEE